MTNETQTAYPAYPVQFSVDYPDRPLNRLTTAASASSSRSRS